ncbi:MAG: DUF3048 domain-containing protein [bacterium]|nr:DUF3048 domain-containing protein [bacterium]
MDKQSLLLRNKQSLLLRNKRKIGIIFLIIVAYAISTGASYALFSRGIVPQKKTILQTPPKITKASGGQVAFDESLPKTEPCPLTGVLYSKEQRQWWEKHRPLGVMIENHQEARPQSGLSDADVIYEAVAEGGITRFLAIFYCLDAGQIGPVRSARTYFLDFTSEYGDYPLYAHVGGANTSGPADALSQINDYGWSGYNDLNQFSIGFPTFWRDYDRLGRTVATEHTMYSTTSKLWDFAKSRGLTNVDKDENLWNESFVPYTFKDDTPASERPAIQTVHLEFWKDYSQYFVDWIYDKAGNLYKRNNEKLAYTDKNNQKTITARNVAVLFMQESNAYDGYENNIHLLYKTKGTGQALVFMDGKEIKATWRKDKRTARTLIFDSNGLPIKFNRGTIWFEILPTTGVAKTQ